tara:strand:+ start:77900 stop:79006 length:1107 start_codon:yes stop_codon:yes gene_type:complete
MRANIMLRKLLSGFLIMMLSFNLMASRVKDITSIQGVRSNQLIGYGLVVGLTGTGDTEAFTKQSFKNMLNQLGITIPANINPNIKNVAAVALHANLPPFSKPGQKIDVTVSSLGNAKSLRGGTLLLAPLKAADGNIYAVAQGSLIVGGLSAEGTDGSKITVNVPVVGRIPNGALVERGIPSSFFMSNHIIFNLHQSDFTAARHVSEIINEYIGAHTAMPLDATSIKVQVPKDIGSRVAFVSAIENLVVEDSMMAAKIIVNSRTGTIVIGKSVRVKPAAVSHGNLTVTITEDQAVSQPNALSQGVTTTTSQSEISVSQDKSRMFLLKPGISLESIVNAVNEVGAAPSDLMAILEALKEAGALNADIEII